MATKLNREGAASTIYNDADDAGLDKPGYSDQNAYRSGKKLPNAQKQTDMDAPSGKGWWESSHGKMPYDSDASDLIKPASVKANMYGGPGSGRGTKYSGKSTSPRPDARGAAKAHVYNKDEDFGM